MYAFSATSVSISRKMFSVFKRSTSLPPTKKIAPTHHRLVLYISFNFKSYNSFRYHKDTAFRMSNVSFAKKNHCDMCSHLATLNPLTFSIPKKISGSAYPVTNLDKMMNTI